MPTEHLEDKYEGEFSDDSESDNLISLWNDKWARLVIGILFGNVMFFCVPFITSSRNTSNAEYQQKYEQLYPTGVAFIVEWLVFVLILALILYYWDKSILKLFFNFFAKLFSPSIAFFIFASGTTALMIALKHYIERYL